MLQSYGDDHISMMMYTCYTSHMRLHNHPDSKVYEANMGPTWGR